MTSLIVNEPSHRCVFQILETVAQMNGVLDSWILNLDCFSKFNLMIEELSEVSFALSNSVHGF